MRQCEIHLRSMLASSSPVLLDLNSHRVVPCFVNGRQVLRKLFFVWSAILLDVRAVISNDVPTSGTSIKPMNISLIAVCSTIISISWTMPILVRFYYMLTYESLPKNIACIDTHAMDKRSARIHSVKVNLCFARSSSRSASFSSSNWTSC